MFSFSGTLSNAHPKICPAALLSATSGIDIKGQIGFYQDSNGSLWLTGTYQYGFQDPKEWDYRYTIQNKCSEILFNLTDSLCMEYAKDSGCNGCNDKSKNYNKKRSIFNKRHEDKCEVDCGDKDGFKYQNCDGPASGFYLVIDGQSKWGKCASIKSPAAINVNNQGGEVAFAAPPAKGPRK
ncbi:4413_t:CDS:2 [Gigaspora rosea]|nr:4413_t:CDS:2 [Gigaspora rosea]